ncbi:MAG: L-threonylcarbamoyladenylate synthase [Ignavibacteria bacterium]|jgi:L-threonylcarbamoyladenylate synthase|nr:L-threonylcarbamoyladenylate synthase [Ignavibacteria bacterium]MDH7528862.1 L-threonylcarbamoyladenylate synthase [Ignavibacteria bacterium]
MKTLVTSSVKIASEFIKKGEVVAFPTETVYGLGANVYDDDAIKKIFVVKRRPTDNPLIVHISNINQIESLVKKINNCAKTIIEIFFPGPITIVLEKNDAISELVSGGLNTIAIRMPSLELTKKFIDECGVPIAAPSANLSGSPSPTSWKHVYNDLNGKIPCILKGPDCEVGIESTVVDCTKNKPVVLRPGIISIEDLKKVFSDVKIYKPKNISKPKSPGMKYKHYAPKAKVILINSEEDLEKIEFDKDKAAFIGLLKIKGLKKIKRVNDLRDYARNIFKFFRQCDEENIEVIFCQSVPEIGLGLAIMNRLTKAAHS